MSPTGGEVHRDAPDHPTVELGDNSLWFPVVGSGWLAVNVHVVAKSGRDPAIGVEWDTSTDGAYASAFIDDEGEFDHVNFGPTPSVQIQLGVSSFDILVLAVYENASEGDALVLAPGPNVTRASSPSTPTAMGSGAHWSYYGEGRRPGTVGAEVIDTRERLPGGAVGPGRVAIRMPPGEVSGTVLADFYLAGSGPGSTWAWVVGDDARSATVTVGGSIGRAAWNGPSRGACFVFETLAPAVDPAIEAAFVVVPFDIGELGRPIVTTFTTKPEGQTANANACP